MKKRLLIVPVTAIALSACGMERQAGFQATLPPPPRPQMAVNSAPADGAIFSAVSGYAPLHYGQRAARVGDLVTIVLTESTRSNKDTSASSDRGGSFSITPPAIGPFSFNGANLNSGSSSSFNGGGDASQTNSLRGTITVTISEVMPNGVARVSGEKLMTLSQGEEWVQISGLMRLVDISADNRIASTRLADARITYAGNGHVQRSSRPGWLSQFFSYVSPF